MSCSLNLLFGDVAVAVAVVVFLSSLMAYTTRNTVNRLMRNELNLNPVVPRKVKGEINLYIELQEHIKLD